MNLKEVVIFVLRKGVPVDIVSDGDREALEFVSSIEPSSAWVNATLIDSEDESREGVLRLKWEDIKCNRY